jgi:GAF domain-containing protein
VTETTDTPETTPEFRNIYENAFTGATVNPVMPDPDEIDEVFAQAANRTLKHAAELARLVIGAHQSAAAIIVEGDWSTIRKYFSLSEKYANWSHYGSPAKGFGIHAWFLQYNQPLRMTQTELEAHPAWMNFGTELAEHPPMRGWMAAPIIDRNGKNWGLFQLSDKYDGDFTQADLDHFVMLAQLVSSALEALWDVRNLQKELRQAQG